MAADTSCPQYAHNMFVLNIKHMSTACLHPHLYANNIASWLGIGNRCCQLRRLAGGCNRCLYHSVAAFSCGATLGRETKECRPQPAVFGQTARVGGYRHVHTEKQAALLRALKT